jgi:hypothetical protein
MAWRARSAGREEVERAEADGSEAGRSPPRRVCACSPRARAAFGVRSDARPPAAVRPREERPRRPGRARSGRPERPRSWARSRRSCPAALPSCPVSPPSCPAALPSCPEARSSCPVGPCSCPEMLHSCPVSLCSCPEIPRHGARNHRFRDARERRWAAARPPGPFSRSPGAGEPFPPGTPGAGDAAEPPAGALTTEAQRHRGRHTERDRRQGSQATTGRRPRALYSSAFQCLVLVCALCPSVVNLPPRLPPPFSALSEPSEFLT